jgi:hypothetical protein
MQDTGALCACEIDAAANLLSILAEDSSKDVLASNALIKQHLHDV